MNAASETMRSLVVKFCRRKCNLNAIVSLSPYFSIQCFNSVGWVTGSASGLKKNWVLACWSFARLIVPVVTTASIIFSASKTS